MLVLFSATYTGHVPWSHTVVTYPGHVLKYVFSVNFFSHYVQTFFIIAVMISVAVGTYRFCVDNESTLSKVGFVGIALICECVLFRLV